MPTSRPPVLAAASGRPCVRGKFIFVGREKLFIRGATYGTFRPDQQGYQYPDAAMVDRDFAQMARNGLNAVRIYTVPPRWLLDSAQRHGLYVMIGLPWEQHVTFLDNRSRMRSIAARVREGVRACSGHPAVLCYAIGNEIPASIVRWYGRHRVERFLKRLCRIARAEDPEGLVTYVNYPSTEYLRLPFVDFVCSNVYLEAQESLEAYLARLHNIAGDRPLIMGEIGLDSKRHGEEAQATSLGDQVRTVCASGCAGAFVFAWTDEWHRGDEVLDWDFGLTDRARRPKPALAAVRAAFAGGLDPAGLRWPRISVVVCSFNGERTIRDCCEGLLLLDYPDYEVIVVDDGSSDRTGAIAQGYGFRVIRTENTGLSTARNVGLAAATGSIVAYLDDDARPDTHWLTYLGRTFMTTEYVGVGGPNIAPPGDGPIAACVANAPGGPSHILLSDREAEHIPGCNMAFRRANLEAIGGFDPQFWVAGDDVDVCWRLQQQGWTLGFSPPAMVWHHRRNSVRAYWKQQLGYGKAEAQLERKWPEKYNAAGQVAWSGRLYGRGLTHVLGWQRERIMYGTWGSAPFQTAHHLAPGLLPSLLLMPEWHLLSGGLGLLALMGMLWRPLIFALPCFVLTGGASLVQALVSSANAGYTDVTRSRTRQLALRTLTAYLYLLQPLARLCGRRGFALAHEWRRGVRRIELPRMKTFTIWSEHWEAPDTWLRAVEAALRADRTTVLRGSACDRWDLEVRSGRLGVTRLRMASEEHGAGKQRIRFRTWPKASPLATGLLLLFALLCAMAAGGGDRIAAIVLGAASLMLGLRIAWSCAAATAVSLHALQMMEWATESVHAATGRAAGHMAGNPHAPSDGAAGHDESSPAETSEAPLGALHGIRATKHPSGSPSRPVSGGITLPPSGRIALPPSGRLALPGTATKSQ